MAVRVQVPLRVQNQSENGGESEHSALIFFLMPIPYVHTPLNKSRTFKTFQSLDRFHL